VLLGEKLIRFILLISLSSLLLAQYSNCKFKNKNYEDVCKRSLKKGVSINYVNEFLLSTKTKKLDEKSFRLFSPKKIALHRKNEKRANNVLVKYVPKIITHVKKYKDVYDKAEAEFGVNREIVAAILMKETKLGLIKPSFDAFEVFNTLVVKLDIKTKRDKWLMSMGKSNMVSIISYCYNKSISPNSCNLASSYAGAVGIPQFMPSSFIYAVPYESKIPDLTNIQDAIMSASNYLNKKSKFNKLIDWDKIPDMPIVEEQWYDYDFEHKHSSFVYAKSKRSGKKYDCFACEKPKLQYLRRYAKKIMSYNNSSNYAIGVMRLAYDTHIGLEK